jgi:hypothetical protein
MSTAGSKGSLRVLLEAASGHWRVIFSTILAACDTMAFCISTAVVKDIGENRLFLGWTPGVTDFFYFQRFLYSTQKSPNTI